jgi:hypothetical protein
MDKIVSMALMLQVLGSVNCAEVTQDNLVLNTRNQGEPLNQLDYSTAITKNGIECKADSGIYWFNDWHQKVYGGTSSYGLSDACRLEINSVW